MLPLLDFSRLKVCVPVGSRIVASELPDARRHSSPSSDDNPQYHKNTVFKNSICAHPYCQRYEIGLHQESPIVIDYPGADESGPCSDEPGSPSASDPSASDPNADESCSKRQKKEQSYFVLSQTCGHVFHENCMSQIVQQLILDDVKHFAPYTADNHFVDAVDVANKFTCPKCVTVMWRDFSEFKDENDRNREAFYLKDGKARVSYSERQNFECYGQQYD